MAILQTIQGITSVGNSIGKKVRETTDKDEYGNELYTGKNTALATIGGLTNPFAAMMEIQKNKDLTSAQKRKLMVSGVLNPIGTGQMYNKMQGEIAEKYKQEQLVNNLRTNTFNNMPTSSVYAYGGDITQYQGNTHQQGGIPIGNNREVEDGETKGIGDSKDYIFSNKIMFDKSKSYADKSKQIEKKYKLRENDSYADIAKIWNYLI